MRKTVLFVFVVVAIAACAFLFSTTGEIARSYSPDGQYSVYGTMFNFEKLAGREMTASGKVHLFDEKNGEVIRSTRIKAMERIKTISWERNKAYFEGDAYPSKDEAWELPNEIVIPEDKKAKAKPMAPAKLNLELLGLNLVNSFTRTQNMLLAKLDSCGRTVSPDPKQVSFTFREGDCNPTSFSRITLKQSDESWSARMLLAGLKCKKLINELEEKLGDNYNYNESGEYSGKKNIYTWEKEMYTAKYQEIVTDGGCFPDLLEITIKKG